MKKHMLASGVRHSFPKTLAAAIGAGVLLPATVRASPAGNEPAAGQDGAAGYASEILDALAQGRYWLEGRYRFEYVETDESIATGRQAYASILRTVLGFESGAWNGFRGTVEFENVSIIGNQQFHDGLHDRYAGVLPTVLDPEVTAINEVFLDYEGIEENLFRLGRQTILLDNQRHVGNVGFRQNDQTYDAFTVNNTYFADVKLFYGYIQNVNTILGADAPMSSHLVNARYETADWGGITGYTYLLDYDDDSASSSTYGVRWTAAHTVADSVDLTWALEAANQTDAYDNETDIDASYFHGEIGGSIPDAPAGLAGKAGFEILEGNEGAVGDKFSTPLATKHSFNGWADMFLTTPDAGLEDYYLGASGAVDRASWALIYHWFDANDGDDTWGDEFDAMVSYPCSKRVTVGAIYASYLAKDWMEDTTKIWLWVGINP
ncbi:MAG: hypothetical protein AB1726_12695 [Planctomycetota bacterium]